jgi:hypothetical protein
VVEVARRPFPFEAQGRRDRRRDKRDSAGQKSIVVDEQQFDWTADDSVSLRSQAATAIYFNNAGDLVIRQERSWDQDDDSFVIVSRNNISDFLDPVTDARGVCDVVHSHPRWVNLGLAFMEAFDSISLSQVGKTAKATGVQPLRDAVMTLLCVELEKILGASKLPKPAKPVRVKAEPKPPQSVTRVPQIETNIALGVELLALREATASNTRFGRLLRAQFKVEQILASRAMRVARCFADKPGVYRRLSWITLVELSSRKMSEAVRRTLVARVSAGEKISATDIRRGGSPKRRNPDQPARMAA